ncbi:MAG TPA: protein kinase [Candidatus Polarisedimenticolia bacterium]|nr:protein kinase [Candidatus Polarisedimenticolia bacterium]
MPLPPGSRLGPYEISAAIGAGGMGEVYRARDTRLGRDVAIKVLPQHLSGDPGRRERFEREARVVSALNHPHICTLFDIGSQPSPEGTVDYLVMEFIEGETLGDRVLKGVLSPGEVLRYAMEIADALDKAHRQGVVHRDLKPQNVMLTKNGAKLLDFGLAKLRDADGGSTAPGAAATPRGATGASPWSGGSRMPTATRDLTTAGTLLGTFQYMAPEQLEGREADARSDIFAFGALVYEMATGRRAFEARSQASLIAAILKEQPRAISEVQPLFPPGLDRVVQACMAKDPDDRVQTARDVRMQLEWVADGSLSGVSRSGLGAGMPGTSSVTSIPGGTMQPVSTPSATVPVSTPSGVGPQPIGESRRRGGAIGGAAIGGVALGLLAAGLFVWLQPAPVRTSLRVNVELPPKTQLSAQDRSVALSPDGRVLAYAGAGEDGKQRLWTRRLDSLQAQPLVGTEGATYPFWSPDGAFIGFFAEQKLRKVPASGGTVQALCEAPDGRGATWNGAGTIVFSPNPYGGLEMVPAAGGKPTTLTTPTGEGWTHRLPYFLPDGRRLLYFSRQPGSTEDSGIYWLDIETKKSTLLTREDSEGQYVAPGFLAFVRDGNLMAQPLDSGTLKMGGEAVPIAERVQFNPSRWTGAYTFSGNGMMVYQSGIGVVRRQLTWIGSDGKEQAKVGEPANIVEMVLAPDQRHAVATVLGGTGGVSLWTYDLARGIGSRFSFGDSDSTPIWSPDSRQIAFVDGPNRVHIKAADGATEPRKLLEASTNRTLSSWLPDGSGILMYVQMPKTGMDVFLVPTSGDPTPKAILSTVANERGAVLSSDGRWLLYSSDESGRMEQYVASYPTGGGKWQISNSGGSGGAWIEGGRRIAYGDPDGKVIGVDVAVQGANLTIGAPQVMFGGVRMEGPVDITRDGQRVLVARATAESAQPALVLVTDWAAGLRKP